MIVGLTGGIGSGKTWVSSLFAEKGVPVYISDIEAKKIIHTNIKVKKGIVELFGPNAYDNDKLNRSFISEKVFTDKELLNQLNAIVHPAVANDFKNWYKKQKAPFVIKESAILFEIGAHKKCDATILITAPVKERIARVQQRDNVSKEDVKKRIENQWSDDKKIPLADYIIENINRDNTINQVYEIYNNLVN